MIDKKLFGTAGETFAASVLYAQGYEILERNYTCSIGEADLICLNGDALCIVEVKTRSSLSMGRPLEAVTPEKIHTMRKVAQHYLMSHGIRNRNVTFQVFEILTNQANFI